MTSVDGACGTAENQTLSSAPTSAASLCSVGTPTSVTDNGIGYIWSCVGTGNGATAGCDAVVATTSGSGTGSFTDTCAGAVNGVNPVNCFIDSLGVNQHLGWGDPTTGVYDDANMEELALAYLGIHQVRDAPPNPDVQSEFQSLAQAGIKFDLITAPGGQDTSSSLPTDLANIDSVAGTVPGSVVSIEGPNELNCQIVYLNGASSNDPSVAVQIQINLYNAVHADPTLTGVKVANNSISNGGCDSWQSYIASEGNMDNEVDLGNWHPYAGAAAPGAAILAGIGYAGQVAPGKLAILTEWGYTTPTWATEQQEAPWAVDGYADAFNGGAIRAYIYELFDENTGDGNTEDNFGLFHTDGSPKPAATAIQNMLAILSATTNANGTTTVSSPAPSVSGLSASGAGLALVGQTGYDVLVWDEGSGSTATVNLGAGYANVNVYDPVLGTTAVQTLHNVSQVTLQVGADPLIVTAQ